MAQVEEDVPLCVATVKELTGKDQATTTEILNAIKSFGDLVSAEVGTVLREQYDDQPDSEWLHVAMEPIEESDVGLHAFNIGRDGDDLWIIATYAPPSSVWHGGHRIVFRARK